MRAFLVVEIMISRIIPLKIVYYYPTKKTEASPSGNWYEK
jgi:hypothetical protein